MTEYIAQGLKNKGVEVSIHNIVDSSVETILKDFEDAKGLLLGSPTLVGDALPPLAIILCSLNPIVHGGRVIQVYGSFGWSGEGVCNLVPRIQQLKSKCTVQPLKIKFKPTEEDDKKCVEFGEAVGAQIVA